MIYLIIHLIMTTGKPSKSLQICLCSIFPFWMCSANHKKRFLHIQSSSFASFPIVKKLKKYYGFPVFPCNLPTDHYFNELSPFCFVFVFIGKQFRESLFHVYLICLLYQEEFKHNLFLSNCLNKGWFKNVLEKSFLPQLLFYYISVLKWYVN